MTAPGADASDEEKERFRLAQQHVADTKAKGMSGKAIAGLVGAALVVYLAIKLFSPAKPEYTVRQDGSNQQVSVTKYAPGDGTKILHDLNGSGFVYIRCNGSTLLASGRPGGDAIEIRNVTCP